ncbi:hypothetical protein BC829DRAFT_421738 [Chytridium lagenaria]|nr:hypothetical protein BC829DRAFT_421738 [Chytridium lagenaria]
MTFKLEPLSNLCFNLLLFTHQSTIVKIILISLISTNSPYIPKGAGNEINGTCLLLSAPIDNTVRHAAGLPELDIFDNIVQLEPDDGRDGYCNGEFEALEDAKRMEEVDIIDNNINDDIENHDENDDDNEGAEDNDNNNDNKVDGLSDIDGIYSNDIGVDNEDGALDDEGTMNIKLLWNRIKDNEDTQNLVLLYHMVTKNNLTHKAYNAMISSPYFQQTQLKALVATYKPSLHLSTGVALKLLSLFGSEARGHQAHAQASRSRVPSRAQDGIELEWKVEEPVVGGGVGGSVNGAAVGGGRWWWLMGSGRGVEREELQRGFEPLMQLEEVGVGGSVVVSGGRWMVRWWWLMGSGRGMGEKELQRLEEGGIGGLVGVGGSVSGAAVGGGRWWWWMGSGRGMEREKLQRGFEPLMQLEEGGIGGLWWVMV